MATAVIGLTGAFGSGCTTAAHALRDDRNFTYLRLSDFLREEWKKAGGAGEPPRSEFQRMGDELRLKHGPNALIDLALGPMVKSPPERLVIDGIRNLGEIQRLREHYGFNFTLIALLSSSDVRWERIKSAAYLGKGLTQVDFYQDDTRDRDEETPWGQQVELCIDKADIFIDNSEEVGLPSFKAKVLQFADLIAGAAPRDATQDEIWMHMAYASAHGSRCLKRHVGSVIVTEAGDVVGTGYNENPRSTNPCASEPEYKNRCFRDVVRNGHFKSLSGIGARCPKCGDPLPTIGGPPWLCPSCTNKGTKTNLEQFFSPIAL